jgi:hypothetical protein
MTTDNLWVPNGSFRPRRYRPGGLGNWSGHLAFANDLIAEVRPNVLVELGTHYGESYFGFCQAVNENDISCSCYAVDTWIGESHSGVYDESVYQEVSAYNSAHYGNFSYLLRTTFDEAVANFSDESIDILHIDGLHTYEAVSHDFRHWFDKVKPGGIVLMHDTMARHADFGVWKFWGELEGSHNHFGFTHSWGLGVLRKAGCKCPDNSLFAALFDGPARYKEHIRKFYAIAALALAHEHDSANSILLTDDRIGARVYPFVDEYSEESSIRHDLAAEKWARCTVELPCGVGNGPLRIDPAEQPAVVDVSAVALRRPLDGEILWSANGCSEVAALEIGGTLARLGVNKSQEFCRFISFGSDPQFFLPRLDRERFDQPLVLEIWLRVQTHVASVLRLLREADQQNSRNRPESSPENQVASGESSANGGHTPEEWSKINEQQNSLQTERDALMRECDSLAVEREASRAARDRAMAELDAVAQERDLLQAEHEKWNSERESLSIAHRKLHSELYVTRTDLSTAKADLSAARSELKSLGECREKCQGLEQTLQQVLTSYSWRITMPVREVMLFLRRRPRSR